MLATLFPYITGEVLACALLYIYNALARHCKSMSASVSIIQLEHSGALLPLLFLPSQGLFRNARLHDTLRVAFFRNDRFLRNHDPSSISLCLSTQSWALPRQRTIFLAQVQAADNWRRSRVRRTTWCILSNAARRTQFRSRMILLLFLSVYRPSSGPFQDKEQSPWPKYRPQTTGEDPQSAGQLGVS